MQYSAIVLNVVASHAVICTMPLNVIEMANCRTRLVHGELAMKPKTRREIAVAEHINVGSMDTNHGSTPK